MWPVPEEDPRGECLKLLCFAVSQSYADSYNKSFHYFFFLFIIFTFYFLLLLSTLSAFFSCVYYKTKLNRPLRKYIRLLGLVVFGFPLLRAGLSGESLATMGKIIYCGCATSAGPCLLRMKRPSRTTHRSFQD